MILPDTPYFSYWCSCLGEGLLPTSLLCALVFETCLKLDKLLFNNSKIVIAIDPWNFEMIITIPHVSCVPCHMSHVICHLSRVFFLQVGGFSWWRFSIFCSFGQNYNNNKKQLLMLIKNFFLKCIYHLQKVHINCSQSGP